MGRRALQATTQESVIDAKNEGIGRVGGARDGKHALSRPWLNDLAVTLPTPYPHFGAGGLRTASRTPAAISARGIVLQRGGGQPVLRKWPRAHGGIAGALAGDGVVSPAAPVRKEKNIPPGATRPRWITRRDHPTARILFSEILSIF